MLSLCLIGLGSNQGNRRQMLDRAVVHLDRHPSIRVTEKSRWHQTAAIGGSPDQPPFLNGAVLAETSLRPQALLEVLGQIETELGRRRSERWGSRTIDLDLLLYDRVVLSTPSLVLPHPRMAWRRFVLQPAAEVAGSMVHPVIGWTVGRLLEHLDTAAAYVAITGSIGAGKTHLARRLARRLDARLIAEPLDLEQLETFYADPAGQAWETELEFLRRRTRLLAADSPRWSDRKRPVVSDFWFDQSPAFARAWLPARQQEEFRRRWERSRGGVVRPKLIVLLDAPPQRLLERVHRRGRRCEQELSRQQLDRIGRAILAEATRADQGPLLRLTSDDRDEVFSEVLAAVQSMEQESSD